MLAQTSHIGWNNLILSGSLHNSLFFLASKQTDFSQKWDLFMNDDCYQRNVLSLSYNYLY